MNHLLRDRAPLSDAAWAAVDQEASERLKTFLAGRKLVDFSGPHGWDYSATNLGRVEPLGGAPAEQVHAAQRRVLPAVELRADFELSVAELLNADRGATGLDLDPLVEAARRIALAENRAVFHGFAPGQVQGITDTCPSDPIAIDEDYDHYPRHVAKAVGVLRDAGIGGPYGMALGPDGYTGVIETTEHGGYPVFEHLGRILGGPLVWAPGVEGAVVLSLRGNDFELVSGQDLSVGYLAHTDDSVRLYLEESFTFRVHEPGAAVCLRRP